MPKKLSRVIEEHLIRPLQALPATRTTTRIELTYDTSIKIQLIFPTASALWKLGDLVAALRILNNYLQPRDSKATLDLTIRGSDRQSAILRIDKVPFERSQAKYIAYEGSTQLDTLDVFWYTDDRVSEADAVSVLDQAREWAAGFPSERVIAVTDAKQFQSGSTLLSFIVRPTHAGWATMNFDEAYRAFTSAKSIGEERTGRPWSAFIAAVTNARNQHVGYIKYLADWNPLDVSLSSFAEDVVPFAAS